MVDRPSPEWTSRQLTSSGPSDFLLETINGPVELPWPMVGWRELPQLLSPRMQEAEQWPATTHMRFDNGLYLRVEPVVHTFEVNLRFALFEDSSRATLTLSMTKAAHHLRGGRGYETKTVVVIPSAKKNRGGTAEDAAGLEDLRIGLGANYARLHVSERRNPAAADIPSWKARTDFIVVGDFRGPMHPPDFSDVARRIGGTTTVLKEFLEKAITRSLFPSTGC